MKHGIEHHHFHFFLYLNLVLAGFLLVIGSLVGGSKTNASVPPTIVSSSVPSTSLGMYPLLVGWWPLNEGTGTAAYDSSGNNATGTWHGVAVGTSGYYSPGAPGTWAGSFDGTSTYISVSNSAALNPTSITVATWINLSSKPPNGAGIVVKDVQTGGEVQNPPYALEVNANSQNVVFELDSSSNNTASCMSPSHISMSAWHYVVGTYDSSSQVGTLYVDGVSVCTFSQSNIAADTANLNIGQQKAAYNYDRFFTGLIDNVQIYDQAFSAAEIQSLFASGIGSHPPEFSVPVAPTGVSAVAADAAATVSFEAPASDGGLSVLYTITANPGGIIATSSVAGPTIISGLTNGVSYTFTVTAANGLSNSPSSAASNAVTPALTTAVVNWNNVDQEIDGFGGSTALEFSPLTSAQANLFFSTSTGIGLSLLRTAVPDDGSCSSIDSTCAGEISDMQKAAALGARVWSTELSPPASMTTNGSTNCDVSPSPSTLKTSSYAAYATYLSNYIASVASEGVQLYAISPQNEPEGCHSYPSSVWTDQDFHNFIENNLGPTLAANNQTSTEIMLPEPGNSTAIQTYADTTMNDPAVAAYVGIIGYHNYNDAAVTNPYPKSGKAFWETEMSGEAGASSALTDCSFCFDPSIANGLIWAQVINNDLVISQDNAWNYWWLISYGDNGDDEGLVSGDGTLTKRLYVVGNYSKFVRPGWSRIDVTVNPTAGVYLSAFKDPTTNDFAIVAINTNSSAIPLSISMSGLSSAVASVTPWVTSADLNLAQQSNLPLSSNGFTPTLPAQSVTTFVGIGGTPPPVVTPPNLSTPSATSISTSAATLNSAITSIGNATATIEGFHYGISTALGLTVFSSGNFTAGSFDLGVKGLLPNTTYHFQAFATNSAGTGTSTIQTLATANVATSIPATSTPSPKITGITVSSITDNSAALKITTNASSSVRVQYGPSASYGNTTPASPELTTIYENLANLNPDTTYDFLVLATPDGATSTISSENEAFTTAAPPGPPAPPISTGGGGGGGGYVPPVVATPNPASSPPPSTPPVVSSSTPTPKSVSIPPAVYFPRTLKVGDTGSDVMLLQTTLRQLGFFPASITPTSYFGTRTQHALLLFQTTHGLAVTGSLTPQSEALMNKVVNAMESVATNTVTAPSASTTTVPTTRADLESLLMSLESELQTLLAEVAAQQAVVPVKIPIITPVPLPASPPPSFGSEGHQVTTMQNILVQDGFLSTGVFTPGTFDPSTLRAVEIFQCINGIVCSGPAYGVVGPKTLAALGMD